MTEEQREQLLCKVGDLLGEHTNAYLLIVSIDDVDGEEIIDHFYEGGLCNALGMMQLAKNRMFKTLVEEQNEDETP